MGTNTVLSKSGECAREGVSRIHGLRPKSPSLLSTVVWGTLRVVKKRVVLMNLSEHGPAQCPDHDTRSSNKLYS